MRLRNKDKIEIYVTLATKATIRERARQLGITMAELVKRALERYLDES